MLVDTLANKLHDKHDIRDMWLGHLCWYYVPGDFRVTLKNWMDSIHDTEISDMVPAPPRAVDAFKRAVAATRGRQTVTDGGYTYKYLPRGAGQSDDSVYRSITVEELDPCQHRLRYNPVVALEYDRDTESILPPIWLPALHEYPQDVQTAVKDRVAEISTRYSMEMDSLGSIKVRELIRHELEDRQMGIQAKPGGGVYFVFDEFSHRLAEVDEMINSFTGCEFHQLPLIDDERQRRMLKEAFEAECLGQVNVMMGEMQELLTGEGGKITMKKAKSYHQRFVNLSDKLASYSDLLNEALEETGNRLKIMQQQCFQIVSAVDR